MPIHITLPSSTTCAVEKSPTDTDADRAMAFWALYYYFSAKGYEIGLDVGRGRRYADGDGTWTETETETKRETGRDTDAGMNMNMTILRIRGPRLPGTGIHTDHALAAVIPAPEEASAASEEDDRENFADDRSHDLTRDQSNDHNNGDGEHSRLEAAMDVFEGDIIHANTNTNETGERRCWSIMVYGWKFIFFKSFQGHEGRRARSVRERFVPWGPPHQYQVRNVLDVRRDCGVIDWVLRYMAQHRA